MEYEIHHFDNIHSNDCKTIAFYSVDSVNTYLDEFEIENEANSHWEVYLLSYNNHVFIDEEFDEIRAYLNAHIYDDFNDDGDIKEIHLQHYDSYESAYEVALDIREGSSKLTYPPLDEDFNIKKVKSTFSIN
jgi:hypothetical protein